MLCYTKTTKQDEEHRIWYGIAVVEDGKITQQADELTTEENMVRDLLEQMNAGNASPIHFFDIVDDFMAQLSYR
jgi:hypothetical protein